MAKDKKAYIMDMADLTRKDDIVADTKRSVEYSHKKRINTMISDRVKEFLITKYGRVSDGINSLALKDMGAL